MKRNEKTNIRAYKQGVTGSNPVGPTSSRKPTPNGVGFFVSRRRLSLFMPSEGKQKKGWPVRASGFLFAGVVSRWENDPDISRGS